jgi:hypothetical protein
MGFKYVIFEGRIGGVTRRFPVIFPDTMVHSDMSEAVRVFAAPAGWGDLAPVSAGAITLGMVACAGDSETLGLKSGGDQDASLIERFPYFHGIV